jgi:hypothetical protein
MNPKEQSPQQNTLARNESILSASVFVGGVALERFVPGAIYAGFIGSTVLFIDSMRRSPK